MTSCPYGRQFIDHSHTAGGPCASTANAWLAMDFVILDKSTAGIRPPGELFRRFSSGERPRLGLIMVPRIGPAERPKLRVPQLRTGARVCSGDTGRQFRDRADACRKPGAMRKVAHDHRKQAGRFVQRLRPESKFHLPTVIARKLTVVPARPRKAGRIDGCARDDSHHFGATHSQVGGQSRNLTNVAVEARP